MVKAVQFKTQSASRELGVRCRIATRGLEADLLIKRPNFKIGRRQSSDLHLDHSSVNADHARVSVKEGRIFFERVGAAPCTMNGREFQAGELFSGDRLRLGSVDVQFVLQEISLVQDRELPSRTVTELKEDIDTLVDLERTEKSAVPALDELVPEDAPTGALEDNTPIADDTDQTETIRKFLLETVPASEDPEEEDDETFAESFSLIEKLTSRPLLKGSQSGASNLALEIAHLRNGDLISLQHVRRGRTCTVPYLNDAHKIRTLSLAKLSAKGTAILQLPTHAHGAVHSDFDSTAELSSRTTSAGLFSRTIQRLNLSVGEQAEVKIGPDTYLIRHILPAAVPTDRSEPWIAPRDQKAFIGSVVAHVVLAALASIYFMYRPATITPVAIDDVDRFVKLELTPEIQKIEEPKIEQPKPEAPKPKAEKPKTKAKPTPAAKKAPPQTGKSAKPAPNVSSMGALGRIGAISTGSRNSAAKLASAATNVQSVRAAGGATTFNISGIVSKLPKGEAQVVRVASLDIKGGLGITDASFGSGLGKGSGIGSRRVKAQEVPVVEAAATVSGSLSREEIAKVVEENIAAIRFCYERELMSSPSLQGKVVAKWVIDTAGRVNQSTIQSSTVKSSSVNSCVANEIKGWQFPKPRGGMVQVVFPFQFAPATF